jgi:hypothetical protein
MIEITCQVIELLSKLEMLSKVKLCSQKYYYDLNCRVNSNKQCELCLTVKAHNNNYYKYSDYYAYVDSKKCVGQGMFVIPRAFELLPALKTLDKDALISIKYEKDTVKIFYDGDVFYENYSSDPDDSHIQLLNTFELDKCLQLSSVVIDYISNLLKVIPPTKGLKDTFFDSVVLDSHPLKSDCLLVLRTDSMRLMYYDFEMETAWPFGCIVVPRDAIAWLTKLKKKSIDKVIVKQRGDYIYFEYGAYRMICDITKEFPHFEDFIKLCVDSFSGFATKALLQDIEYATFGKGDIPVTIKAKNQQAEVTSDDDLRKRRMNCATELDNDLDFTVYAYQLTSVLKVCGKLVDIYQLSGVSNMYKINSPDKNFHYIISGFQQRQY